MIEKTHLMCFLYHMNNFFKLLTWTDPFSIIYVYWTGPRAVWTDPYHTGTQTSEPDK
ncbi:MAG TPA: hypothetical protein VKX46_16005 [Ktedonobacteraceae bacterium]|nr:hypothetical protein [Ktedonobacteraceae bacterium]